ncbi:GNAT family N-acetyltransferase [Halalkalibaculum sp. DA3122]|uniref:GNAT family N-acetyltransferase n=1 Tax=unclassified Halalkalibaculum TaxID=2964617 RepID=UPI0037542E10
MVTIKPFDQQNVALHYKWSNDEELNYFDSEDIHKVESFESFLRHIKSVVDEKNATADLFEIHLSGNGKLIGIVDLHEIDPQNRRCYVKCSIGDRKYTGKKYEVEALRKTLAYCFNELEMHKVCTAAFDFNTTWIEEVQKLGFRQEGKLREHLRRDDGYCDKLVFGLLDQEFEQAQQETELHPVNQHAG